MYLLALTLGLSCGAACGGLVTPFMTSYVIGKQQNKKEAFISLIYFSMGKILVMMFLGAMSALFGSDVLSIMQSICPFSLRYLFNIIMIIVGIYIVFSSIKKKKKCSTCNCSGKKLDKEVEGYSQNIIKGYGAIFLSGIIYGITPCAPLGILLAAAVGQSIINGILLLGFFGLITCLSPVIIQIFIAGLMMPVMKKEIPKKIHYLSIVSGCAMIILGILPWIKGA